MVGRLALQEQLVVCAPTRPPADSRDPQNANMLTEIIFFSHERAALPKFHLYETDNTTKLGSRDRCSELKIMLFHTPFIQVYNVSHEKWYNQNITRSLEKWHN